MEKELSKKEILAQIKELQEKNNSESVEMKKIKEQREALEKEEIKKEKLSEEEKIPEIEKGSTIIPNEKKKTLKIVFEGEKAVILKEGEEKIKEEKKTETNKDDTEDVEFEETIVEKQKKPRGKEFDTEKVKDEINSKIVEIEKEKSTPLREEEKQKMAREMFLKYKEDFNKEILESSSILTKGWKKTEKWWTQDLEKTRAKKIAKVMMSAGLIGTATIMGASLVGTPPSMFGIVKKLTLRVGMATGINIFLTKNANKNRDETREEKSKLKKFLFNQNTLMVAGITGSALSALVFSTGGLVFLIGAGGIVARRALNTWLDKNIKKTEEALAKISTKSEIEKPKDNFDINNFVTYLDMIGNEYDKMDKHLKHLKWGKNIMNGALTIGVGVSTMATLSHDQVEAEVKTKNDLELKHQTGLKNPEEIKTQVEHETETKQEELKHQEELKAKIEEGIKLKDATVGKGEGIEHAFIRQIEHDHELAKELGFKGDINDANALHEFAGREAHIIARETGYVDDTGHEVRVAEADKVAYEIKMENGHITIDEKTIGGETLETHHEGDKFEEKADKYESNYVKSEETLAINSEKQILNEHLNTGNEEIRNEYIDTSKPEEEQNGLHSTQNESLNSHNLPEEVLKQINDVSRHNIEIISPENPDVFKNIQLNADETVKYDLETANDTYKPSISYIQALEKATGIHPRGITVFQSPETNTEYIDRVSQIEAMNGNLLKVTIDSVGITHIDKVKF